MAGTRERIMTCALRLFGERGFAGTTVAQVERAAGLSAGSGALYRHFTSKDELLVESVRWRLQDRGEWAPFLSDGFSLAAVLQESPEQPLEDGLFELCRLGLRRLEHDRDVSRILMRDNSVNTQVLEVFRREEFALIASVVARGLAELVPHAQDEDWDATAAVIVGAVSHYWLISDTFGGTHPLAVDADRYLRATASMLAVRLEAAGAHRPCP